MPVILDPLTQLEDAIISWLQDDPDVSAYNWQRWDSDAPTVQPGGYVNVSAVGDLDLAIQGPILLKAEIAMQGKPARGSQQLVLATLLAMMSGREIVGHINDQITDGSLKIVGPAESANVLQVIQKDIRVRTLTVTFPAIWNVVYEPSGPSLSTIRVTTDDRRRVTIDGRTRIIHG